MSEAITSKIIEDAKLIAASTLEEGRAKAGEILADAKNQADIYIQKNRSEIAELKKEVLRRRISVANLEAKKLGLRAKKEILDSVFTRASEKILKLDKGGYLKIIEGMLAEAQDGDTVIIPEKDKKIITKAFIEGYAKKRGIKLTLSDSYADIKGGIILSSGSVDKNLSLEVEMGALREELESEVAQKLFGDNE